MYRIYSNKHLQECCNSDVLKMTFLRQYQTFTVMKPICVTFSHFFSHKKWEGLFIREGAFIRIHTVYDKANLKVLDHPVLHHNDMSFHKLNYKLF